MFVCNYKSVAKGKIDWTLLIKFIYAIDADDELSLYSTKHSSPRNEQKINK
jgi:hypothetical protein